MKILVADDDMVSRRILQKMLQDGGYDVVLAKDGCEASDELSKRDGPRLGLIDWMMPGLSGPTVCRTIRARHDDAYTYLVLLTSRESKDDIIAGLEAGADDYLTKPISSAELRARLLTGRRILQLENRLVEAREEMRFRATHDSLTSLWDRGAILSLLHSELHRASRATAPVSLMLCDVDHFKKVNDTYGHPAGDAVLREVAQRLLKGVRPYDAVGVYSGAVGRYGGEEFLIVLSGCDANHAPKRAESLREAVASQPFVVGSCEMNVTMSVGLVTALPTNGRFSIDDVLARADAGLYQAKAKGRNRVVSCGCVVGNHQEGMAGATAILSSSDAHSYLLAEGAGGT